LPFSPRLPLTAVCTMMPGGSRQGGRKRGQPRLGTTVVKIIQTSSRTVRIETQGGSLSLPYRIYWNGHDREPESTVLEGNQVRAFFLFATIKDDIFEDEHGIRIERAWSIATPGTIRVSIEADFTTADGRLSFLFPGVCAGDVASESRSLLGERTSLPSSLFVFTQTSGVLLFTDFPREDQEAASIGTRRLHGEEGPVLAAEVRLPPIEEPRGVVGPKSEHSIEPHILDIESAGNLEMRHTLYVVFAARRAVVVKGISAALARLPRESRPAETSLNGFKAAAVSCLETHLRRSGGVMGLREVPGSQYISASASLEMAALLLKLSSADSNLLETALRLADFCLKGQHPSGLFFESYSLERGEWLGARGRIGRRPGVQAGSVLKAPPMKGGGTPPDSRQAADRLIPLAESARIADLFLSLSEVLARRGLPGEKYRLAGERFVEFFLDEKGRFDQPGALHCAGEREPVEKGLSAFEVFFPFLRMYRETGRDRYKKALSVMAKQFLALPWDIARPPSWREDRAPDSRAALLCGRLAAEIAGSGCGDVDAEVFLSLLAPWIHVNRSMHRQLADPLGGIADSFNRQRLLFAGAETAYVLLSLAGLAKSKCTRDLASELAKLAFGFTRQAPLGTGFFQHTRWDPGGKAVEWESGVIGPVDSRRLAREAGFAVRLHEEFPAWLEGGSRPKARRPEAGGAREGGSRPKARRPAKRKAGTQKSSRKKSPRS
jgi:hypothetical protein